MSSGSFAQFLNEPHIPPPSLILCARRLNPCNLPEITLDSLKCFKPSGYYIKPRWYKVLVTENYKVASKSKIIGSVIRQK